MDDWDSLGYECPICGSKDCVPACGPISSSILIIGAYPGDEEVKAGRPMVGANGGLLRTELAMNGIDLAGLRVGNIWLHPSNKDEKCLEYGATQIIKEAKGRKAILLLGAEPVKYFCKVSVEKYNGLQVQSDLLSAPLIMACVQPATCFHGSAGEFKLSIKKFCERIEEL